jgi:putative hemolysin
MEKETSGKFVDVENIIRNKNPKLLRVLPRFIVNYIKRVIHEDDINDFIRIHGHKKEFEFIEAVIAKFNVKTNIYGFDHLPEKGGCIVVSNHPLGGLDALTLVHAISSKRKDIRFLVNDILLGLENLKNLFIPVNKHGRNTVKMLEEIDNQYASDSVTCIFPAGLVSRKQDGVIKDLEWKKSFVTKARQHKKNIIPVYIDARNSSFFYNLAFWRKKIGINANIEMFFLVEEIFKQRNKTINIIFGEPIPYTSITNTRRDAEWAEEIKKIVYQTGSDFLKTNRVI